MTSGLLTIAGRRGMTIATVVGGSVTGLAVQGQGGVTLSNTNLYTGGTTVNGGLLIIGNSAALSNAH